MRTIKVLIAMFAIFAGASVAQAGGLVKFGPKVGVTVNEFHFSKSDFGSSNKTGWTAGLMTEFKIPFVGLGADLSLMYVRRNSEFLHQNNLTKDNRDYIEIPLNLRYNFSFPIVSKIAVPYLAIGPSASVLTSHKTIGGIMKNKSVDWALNFGVGCQLVSHLDINLRYGLGLTKAVNGIAGGEAAGIQGKNRYWTITAAYLF